MQTSPLPKITGETPVPLRIERDGLGELPIPAEALHGIHTQRALENFPLARRAIHPELARA